MPVSLEVSYFNTFYVKRIKNRSVTDDNAVTVGLLFASSTGVTAETSNVGPTYPATPYPQALNPAA